MGVRAPEHRPGWRPAPRGRVDGPGWPATLVVALVVAVLLLANGRPVGPADASGAAGWLLRAALAAAAGAIDVDAHATALVGKLLAAILAVFAAAVLFRTVAARHGAGDGAWSAAALAVGTTLAFAAQAWSAEVVATLLVTLGLSLLVRGDQDDGPRVAAAAGLPLALAVAAQPSVLPLAFVLVAMPLLRWPRSSGWLLAWTAAGAAIGAAALFSAQTPAAPAPAAASAAAPGALGLFLSPAKGLLVFAPVTLVGAIGLLAALRSAGGSRYWDQPEPSRALPIACGLGAVAHLATIAVLGTWDVAGFWGPRWLAPAWPLLLLFLPEGLAATKALGALLLLGSIGVQVVGLASYDGRWDRLYRGADGRLEAAAWSLGDSPLAFQWREGVLRHALPVREGAKLRVRERELVESGEPASMVTFTGDVLRSLGADPTFDSVRLQKGARLENGALVLGAQGDAIAFRVREGSRIRRLEIRVVGRGTGTLAIGDTAAWQETHWRTKAVSGAFRLRLPYSFGDGHGPQLAVALASGGPLRLESVALVPPTEPQNVIRLP